MMDDRTVVLLSIRVDRMRLQGHIDRVAAYIAEAYPDTDPPPARRKLIESLVEVLRAAAHFNAAPS